MQFIGQPEGDLEEVGPHEAQSLTAILHAAEESSSVLPLSEITKKAMG